MQRAFLSCLVLTCSCAVDADDDGSFGSPHGDLGRGVDCAADEYLVGQRCVLHGLDAGSKGDAGRDARAAQPAADAGLVPCAVGMLTSCLDASGSTP